MKKDIIEYLKSIGVSDESTPVPEWHISIAQGILGVKFSDDYIKVLETYGEIEVRQTEIYGLISPSSGNVIIETLLARLEDPTTPKDMYIIEDIGYEGVTSWQDSSGKIYCKYPLDEELYYDSDSLVGYLEKIHKKDNEEDY